MPAIASRRECIVALLLCLASACAAAPPARPPLVEPPAPAASAPAPRNEFEVHANLAPGQRIDVVALVLAGGELRYEFATDGQAVDLSTYAHPFSDLTVAGDQLEVKCPGHADDAMKRILHVHERQKNLGLRSHDTGLYTLSFVNPQAEPVRLDANLFLDSKAMIVHVDGHPVAGPSGR
jgi:hypothetical protein